MIVMTHSFPESFKKQRKGLGLTQADVAKACGLTRITITQYENGRNIPSINVLKPLEELGFDLVELLGLSTLKVFDSLDCSRSQVEIYEDFNRRKYYSETSDSLREKLELNNEKAKKIALKINMMSAEKSPEKLIDMYFTAVTELVQESR